MTIREDPEMPFGPSFLASLQEGEEWVSRLQLEQAMLEVDIILNKDGLSAIGLASLEFSLDKTVKAIEQIKLEMLMLDE
jgi:hypothetical protein